MEEWKLEREYSVLEATIEVVKVININESLSKISFKVLAGFNDN